MACNDIETRTWIRVPNQSTFLLDIEDADASSVRMSVNGKEEDYDSANPLTLESPNRYRWWITVRHGDDQPRVKAHILRPPALVPPEQHGTPYCHEPEGENGEVDFVTLAARTRLGA